MTPFYVRSGFHDLRRLDIKILVKCSEFVMALDFDTYLIASSPVELQLPVRFFRRRRSNDNIDVSAAAATAAPAAVRTEELQRQFADIGIGNQHNSIGCFDDNLEDDNDNVDGFGLTKCQDR